MTESFHFAAFALYLVASAGLFAFGLNCYIMLALFARRARTTTANQLETEARWNALHPPDTDSNLPVVTTQIPLFNELNVAELVIRAVADFDYPKDKHQVQVLDDSTDETRELVDRVAAEIRATGVWIDVIRREDRKGYKAGALSDAMPAAKGEFIAIFDGDFVPAPDFLRRMLPHLENPRTGLAQARWGHLNHRQSLLTRAQSLGIDGHFLIEQTARSTNGLFLNFNGTAGIWRRRTIEDAGGWTADTLTEDLDLSYRAQLRGWHLEYVSHVVVPAEIPETYTAFKSQQFRWAKGSIQTAIKLLPQVLASDQRPLAKIQSVIHLCRYLAHPLMLAVALLALPALFQYSSSGSISLAWMAVIAIQLIFSTCGPSALYITSQRLLHPGGWLKRIAIIPALMLVGFGICISNTRAVLEALLGVKSGFVRTPKSGNTTAKTYRARANWLPIFEIATGLYVAWTFWCFARTGQLLFLPFIGLYVGGFCIVGWSSLREQLRSA